MVKSRHEITSFVWSRAVRVTLGLVLTLSSMPSAARDRSETSGTTGCYTAACRARSHHKPTTSKISYSPSKKGRYKKSGKGGASYSCPQGKGYVARKCPNLEPAIAKVLGKKNVSCYSNLFGVESGCSAKVRHDPKKAHNPYEGIGLCAIEKSPAVRRKNGRGPKCANIGTTEGQIRCCAHLMTSTGGRYFGTVRCGNTPRCGG